jgi:hypothetical protein
VALAALLFVPTVMIRGKISQRLKGSQKLGNEIESAIRSVVPVKQLEALKIYEDKHQQDTNEIQKLAIQTTQRELLSYKIFPEPNETSIQIFNEFKKAYNTAFVNLIKDMNALDAPTDIEIKKEAGSAQIETQLGESTDRNVDKSSKEIIELLCKKRSQQIPVYANPQVFSGYAFWNNWEYRGTEPAVANCWYCQLAYWIQKDIVDTIININSGSKLVANSSVKRLLGIQFQGRDAISSGTELPSYVINNGGGLCWPWTDRISNEKIDVVHFSLAVIIRADDVFKFMDQLCSQKQHCFSGYNGDQPLQQFKHNQITILQSYIEPVDKLDATHNNYRYGQDTIVYLNLICEYIFNREGYDTIKPNSAKQELESSKISATQQVEQPVSEEAMEKQE